MSSNLLFFGSFAAWDPRFRSYFITTNGFCVNNLLGNSFGYKLLILNLDFGIFDPVESVDDIYIYIYRLKKLEGHNGDEDYYSERLESHKGDKDYYSAESESHNGGEYCSEDDPEENFSMVDDYYCGASSGSGEADGNTGQKNVNIVTLRNAKQ